MDRSFRFVQTCGLLIPTQNLRHILPALVIRFRETDASQSPYSGCQNALTSRNGRRNFLKFVKNHN
jgi:hypothetical protein